MDLLIQATIVLGSILMVVNIVRYTVFSKRISKTESVHTSKALLYIPLLLLVFFLFSYLAVAAFGSPDIVMSGILFGGSVFVFLLLEIVFRIVDRITESERALDIRYTEMKNELDGLIKDSISVFRVNLTKDEIEDRAGSELYDSDLAAATYTKLMDGRYPYLLAKIDAEPDLFKREGLLEQFSQGHTEVSETLLARRANGRTGFIKLTASLAEHPTTGDVIAFITERGHNDEIVNRTILEKGLAEQFDMIAYIVDDRLEIVAGDAGDASKACVIPEERSIPYGDYINDHIAPMIDRSEEEKEKTVARFRLDLLAKELAEKTRYKVSAELTREGTTYYKQFDFFSVNSDAQFYILLISDTTEIQRERAEQNKRLTVALGEAERASNAKSAFLSNMSHDMRTPMNAVIGFTELAGKTDDPAEVRGYLEKIDSSGKHLLSIINDVLDMSRIESGKTELAPAPADLVELIDGIKDLFAVQMSKKNISFTVDRAGIRDRYVECDKTRLDRILLNLVSNAYKFTPSGGSVTMTASQREDAPDGKARFTLTVRDTGIGMSEGFTKKVFDAFERDKGSSVDKIQGTGLGMAITKSFVELMGGTISVNSKLGEGTEFTVDIAFPKCDSPVEGGSAAPDDTCDYSKYRLLIVDDTEINREIARLMLSDCGFEIEEACDGSEAVDMIAAADPDHYDLVLMDVQMPVMNGYEASAAIRKMDGRRGELPVIAITANVFSKEANAERNAGMNGHVSKPFNSAELIAEIVRLLPAK